MPLRRAERTSGCFTPAETSHHSVSPNDKQHTTPDDGMFRDGRPVKKRKLEIRAVPKQQTLDSLGFFNRAGAGVAATTPVQPPNRVTLAEPHGQLIETINGVQTELDITEDDALEGVEKEDIYTLSTAVAAPEPVPVVQPVEKRKKEERRSLRSRDDGPKLKSELAMYFGNYEDIMFDSPVEPEFITTESTIYITDDAPKVVKAETPSPSKNSKQARETPNSARTNGMPPATPQRSSPTSYNGCQVVDLSTFLKNVPDHPDDPLSEEAFLKSHKRAERKEKQLRNIERERAMHEKFQLDRLLDGLQGHDWLKVLGITGVTDSEAKRYEAKRDYFIAEVQALVDKFQQWKDEEKRQRIEREAALAAEREAEEDDDDSKSLSSSESSSEPPSSDLNASAARQLQQETASALKSNPKQASSAQKKPPPKPKDRASIVPPSDPIPYRPPSPITSFYSKRHVRDAALKKTRHGRSVTAFGQPLPEPKEREFELPADYVTAEVLKARGREWRRRKRESAANAAGRG
jgi:hypothetical protein